MDIRDIINFDNLVVHELQESLVLLKQDLSRAEGGCNTYVFSLDKEEEIAELKRHIDSFETVLKWYGG